MILFLDASALVKRYLAEPSFAEVEALIGRARPPRPTKRRSTNLAIEAESRFVVHSPSAMPKKSAGLLMFRRSPGAQLQVLLVHPGGPFWARKDLGTWTVPKGEYDDSENALEAAKREFAEETRFPVSGPFLPLGSLKQPSGKMVSAWAFESDCDPAALVSNTFEMEWPPKSGRKASFAEVDRAGWFSVGEAREKLTKGQVGFLDALEKAVPRDSPPSEGPK